MFREHKQRNILYLSVSIGQLDKWNQDTLECDSDPYNLEFFQKRKKREFLLRNPPKHIEFDRIKKLNKISKCGQHKDQGWRTLAQ